MKKKLFCLLLIVSVLFCLALPVFAEGEETGYVLYDLDGFLTDEQMDSFDDRSDDIARQYGVAVYLVVLGDYTEYSNGDVRACAEEIFEYYQLGLGADQNGVMLLLSMEERDYALIAHGDIANAAFTDYGKDVMSDRFLPYFSDDDWMGGFTAYQEACADLLWQAANGTPVDVPGYEGGYASEPADMTGVKAGANVAVPALVSLIACGGMKRSMKSTRRQTGAARYVRQNGVNLYAQSDLFTGRTQTVRVIHKETRSSGGGGTTVNSHGFSGKSGKF